jgi:hypothetical protein
VTGGQRDTVPANVLTLKSPFSLSMPWRPLYSDVPEAIVHRDVPTFVSILTTNVIVPFRPIVTYRSPGALAVRLSPLDALGLLPCAPDVEGGERAQHRIVRLDPPEEVLRHLGRRQLSPAHQLAQLPGREARQVAHHSLPFGQHGTNADYHWVSVSAGGGNTRVTQSSS